MYNYNFRASLCFVDASVYILKIDTRWVHDSVKIIIGYNEFMVHSMHEHYKWKKVILC